MTPFSDMSFFLWGVIGTWMMILLFGFVLLEAFAIIAKQGRKRYYLPIIIGILYLMLQSITLIITEGTSVKSLLETVQGFLTLPHGVMIAICALLTAILLIFFQHARIWRKENVTNMSIKHAVDIFPEGICYYDHHGRIWLKNHMMNCLSYMLTGESLLNGEHFYKKLCIGELKEGCKTENVAENQLLVLAEEKAFSVTKQQIEHDGQKLNFLVAADITEEYHKTEELLLRQQQLRRLNSELKKYNKEIASVISEREILNAKMRIHDQLGISLLTSKRYILSGGTEEEKQAIISSLRQNINYLQLEQEIDTGDEYASLFRAAQDLGICIKLDGELPQQAETKHIFVTAIHECLTNTIRHAKGDLLEVSLHETKDTFVARLTNNGKQPAKPIIETGGLASLRKSVQKSGGNMKVDWKERFVLTIEVPKEGMDEI